MTLQSPTAGFASAEKPFPWLTQLNESPVDVTLMVPCYNEEDNVVPTLETIVKALGETSYSYEVIVIDDCSTDRTSEKVAEFQQQHPDLPIRLVTRSKNKGLAHNFYDGAFMARGRYYRLVCGDNVELVSTITTILGLMGTADIILPYHVAAGRHPARLALSHLFTWLVNVLSGNHIRYYNGAPLFRTWDVLRWHVEASGFGFQAEFVTRLLEMGWSYQEIGVTAQDRQTGKSRALSTRNWLSAGYTLFKIFARTVRTRVLFGGRREA